MTSIADEHPIVAIYAGAKRRIAALEQQLQNLQEAGTRQKSNSHSNVTQGRAICRLVSMFDSVDELVEENDRRRALELDTEFDGEFQTEHTLEQDRTYRGYNLLLHHIPSLKNKLVEQDVLELNAYFRDLRKGAGGGRGDDAANLKPAVVSWISGVLGSPISKPLQPTSKIDRGFDHDDIGRLLCPIEYNWEDSGVRTQIRDGHQDYIVTADSWPAFLYPNARGNTDNIELGLFRSAILLKAFKFIFTSPSSAQDIEGQEDVESHIPSSRKRSRRNQKAPTRGHVANLLGMKSVTPRAIAYVAVQLRFALSNANAWCENDGCFSYINFYNHIVDYFELPLGPESQSNTTSLLSWWTSKVFGGRPVIISTHGLSHPGSSVAQLANQRAAREHSQRAGIST